MHTFTNRQRWIRAILFGVILIMMVTLVPPADAESATVTSSGPDNVSPGSTATVSFTVSNTGSNESSYIVDVLVPSDWTVASQTNDGGVWNKNKKSWLYQTISPGNSVEPTLTITAPPSQADNSSTIRVKIKSPDGNEATHRHNIKVTETENYSDQSPSEEKNSTKSEIGGSTSPEIKDTSAKNGSSSENKNTGVNDTSAQNESMFSRADSIKNGNKSTLNQSESDEPDSTNSSEQQTRQSDNINESVSDERDGTGVTVPGFSIYTMLVALLTVTTILAIKRKTSTE